MKNFIVRIYRCEENRPDHYVGVVENVTSEEKHAFSNYDELWSILNPGGTSELNGSPPSQL